MPDSVLIVLHTFYLILSIYESIMPHFTHEKTEAYRLSLIICVYKKIYHCIYSISDI